MLNAAVRFHSVVKVLGNVPQQVPWLGACNDVVDYVPLGSRQSFDYVFASVAYA